MPTMNIVSIMVRELMGGNHVDRQVTASLYCWPGSICCCPVEEQPRLLVYLVKHEFCYIAKLLVPVGPGCFF